jgi:hypothetical protein
MLERIWNLKGRGRYQEDGILCKRYKEIPEGIENIGIRIPAICSVKSKDARRIRFTLTSAQTQKELEDYRLQELEEDPYRFELEDDPTKEQEEYFRRITSGMDGTWIF